MTIPAVAAKPSRGPLFWVLGCLGLGAACSCMGVAGLMVMGMMSKDGGTSGGGSSSGSSGSADTVVAPGDPSATPGTKSTITNVDMVGTWHTGAASSTDYVTDSGAYSHSNTVFYGERYDIREDGTYDYRFDGMSNSYPVHEKESGSWALSGAQIIFSPSGAAARPFWFRGYEVRADGSRLLKVLNGRNPNESGYDLYVENWGRNP